MLEKKLKVLIADDEKIARESMRDYLPWDDMGMEQPVCVENGALAWDYLCSHPVDLFIMDIRMPVMDGMMLLEKISQKDWEMQIIVLSAYDQFAYAQKAIQSRKVFEYVLKPIKRKEFCTILKRAAMEQLNRKSKADSISVEGNLEIIYKAFMLSLTYGNLENAVELIRGYKDQWKNEELASLQLLFTSLYTELQTNTNKLAGKNVCPLQKEKIHALQHSSGPEELWEEFKSLADELRPYWVEDQDAGRTKTTAVIEHCLEEINKHYTEADFSLYKLAEEMKLNANYLSTRFKKECGMGFVRYINQLRIEKAKILLKDMRHRTNEVAAMVGFDNPRYFTRIFKEMTGLIPSEYRSRIKTYTNMPDTRDD